MFNSVNCGGLHKMETIGDRIKIVRKDECFMTQAEFAEVLGVTNAHISKIEKGITMPSEALTKLIYKSFDISEYWLKDGIKPIYTEQLEDESDKNLTFAIRENNKLINNEDPLIRLTASKLQTLFANITNTDKICQENKLSYLRTLLHLFRYINDTIETFKQCSENKEIELTDKDIDNLLLFNMKSIELEFRELAEFWSEV